MRFDGVIYLRPFGPVLDRWRLPEKPSIYHQAVGDDVPVVHGHLKTSGDNLIRKSFIDDLLSGSEKRNYLRIPDRKEAIWKALSMAEPDDTVLVAGKGRDNYMALGTEYLPYCDYDTIKEFYS